MSLGTTSTIEAPTTREYRYDEGDDNKFSHYVNKDAIVTASVEGIPMVALCGYTWIPGRDPQRFPVCPKCKEIFDVLPPR